MRGQSAHDYLLNFQLAAPAALQWRSDDSGTLLETDGLTVAQPHRVGHTARLDDGWVSPRYGHKHSAIALRTQVRSRDADFDSALLPWRDAAPHLRVGTLPAVNVRGECLEALLIETGETIDGWFHARGGDEHRPWRIGKRVFTGRWLHWREDADGRLLRAVSHAGASLHTTDGAWPLDQP